MPKIFYGWILVAVAWIIYGFGIAPAYYSWGQFAPKVIEELGLTHEVPCGTVHFRKLVARLFGLIPATHEYQLA